MPSHEDILAQIRPYRNTGQRQRPSNIETPGPGQRSVWDFPRPPMVQAVPDRVHVVFASKIIADTRAALRISETAGAPVYYLPPTDVMPDCLLPLDKVTICEWKGAAVYFDVQTGNKRAPAAAFCYPDPLTDLGQGYDRIAGYIGFYAQAMDACFIGDEQVTPQPGGFYAGWVTADLTGPIKGEPGSEGW